MISHYVIELNRVQNADLPEIVQKYLNAGKYCLQCGKLALRFQITASAETTRSICEGGMARCLICPVGECITKKILCYNCDMRAKRRISGAGGKGKLISCHESMYHNHTDIKHSTSVIR